MYWILCAILCVQPGISAPDDADAHRRAVARASDLMRTGSVDWNSTLVTRPTRATPSSRAQTATPVLEETAQAEDPETRLHALEALADSNGIEHLDRFLRALTDPVPEIRDLAAGFLARQDAGQVFDQFMNLLARGGAEGLARLDVAIPLLRAGFEPRLLQVLSTPDESPARKRIAAYCLGRMNSVAAVPALAECAWNADEPIALACVTALLEVRDPVVIRRLVDLAAHTLPSVRKAAVDGLIDVGGPEALAALGQLALTPSDNEDAAREAVLALGAMKMEAAIPLLIEVMRKNVAARRSAVQALRQLTGDDAGDLPSDWQDWYERRLKAAQSNNEQSQESPYEVEYMK